LFVLLSLFDAGMHSDLLNSTPLIDATAAHSSFNEFNKAEKLRQG